MYVMHEAMVQERMREAEHRAAQARMRRRNASAERWRWVQRAARWAEAHANAQVRRHVESVSY